MITSFVKLYSNVLYVQFVFLLLCSCEKDTSFFVFENIVLLSIASENINHGNLNNFVCVQCHNHNFHL